MGRTALETRRLGQSDLRVSALGLGCWPLGGGVGWGDLEERQAIATIHAALDNGITLLDTAEGYNDGHSEEVVGKALVGRRERAVVATKISPSNTEPATLRAHCEASLLRLRTDYIDLYQVHWPIEDASVEDAFATLQALQVEGKVRAIGVSNHGVQQLGEVLATGVCIVSNQLHYNLLSRAIETDIVPLCIEHKIGVIAYMPLMQGLLAGRYASADKVPPFRARTRHFSSTRAEARHGQPGAEAETFEAIAKIRDIAEELEMPMAQLAIAWTLAKPGVSSVLVGSRTPEQIARNAASASVALTSEQVARLDRVTEVLRIKLGPNADYWQGETTTRTR